LSIRIRLITSTLSEQRDLDAVHIISHGSEGVIDLGGTQLEFDTLLANSTAIQGWSEAFSEQGDILIYGCNLAASAGGQALVESLARLTGADVAASDDITGNASLGGNWELEYRQGEIDTQIAVSAMLQQQWDGLLAAPTFWDYHHTIDLAAPTAVADYPIKLELIEGTNGFNHANAQPNGEDLRFFDAVGNELSYWIEDWNSSGISTVWVKVATVSTSSIDMYYGNEGVASASDPDAAFLFHDDLADGTDGSPAAGWTPVAGATSGIQPTVQDDAGNLVYSDGANSGGPVVSAGNWSDVVVSQDFRTINAADPINHAGVIARYEDVNNMVYGGIINKDTAQIWYREAGTWTQIGGDWSITGLTVDDGNWHNQALRLHGDTVELYVDDVLIGSASVAGTGSAAGTSGQTGFWSQYSNYEAYRDNHIVRSYDAGTGDIATAVVNEGFALDENSPNGTVVGNVLATDPDVADILTYSITAGNTGSAFAIDNNGWITVNNSAALDFETNPTFTVTVEVDDGNGGIDTDTVTISLNDINDAPVLHAWYNVAWEYRKDITIDASKAQANLTDFPVLITLNTDADLAAFAQADGDDILFYCCGRYNKAGTRDRKL